MTINLCPLSFRAPSTEGTNTAVGLQFPTINKKLVVLEMTLNFRPFCVLGALRQRVININIEKAAKTKIYVENPG